jgi:hypothetical protein
VDHIAGTVVYDMGANVDVVQNVDKADRAQIAFTRPNVSGNVLNKRFEGPAGGPPITFEYSDVAHAVRTGVFNEQGVTDNPVITEANVVVITDDSLLEITVEDLANAPATNIGIFNSNTPYVRFIKGLSS